MTFNDKSISSGERLRAAYSPPLGWLRAAMATTLAILLILSPVLTGAGRAQTTTGTILGLVIKIDDSPLEGAIVRIVNNANGLARVARTDATGTYRFDLILPGGYNITASADGYRPNMLQNFVVEVNREKVIKPPPIRLEVVTATPAPAATATAAPPPPPPGMPAPPAVGTTQAGVSDPALRGSATAEFITSLPLRGIRNFDAFALLSPGVLPPAAFFGVSGPGLSAELGSGDFSVNGLRPRGNNYTIDGSDNNDQDVGGRRRGYTATSPQSIESLREFQITTVLSDVEAGRNVGGQVNVVSKTGGNDFHGGLYSLFTDSRLSARDAFEFRPGLTDNKNPFTRHQSGGTLGGPIIRDRFHFFSSYERQDVNRTQTLNYSVPTATERASALALVPFGNNFLARDIFQLFPLPNNPGGPFGANNLTQVLRARGDGNIASVRTDYQFSPFGKASLLTFRYNLSDDETLIPAVGNAINSGINSRTRTNNFAFDLTTQLSSRFSNQVRLSYGRNTLNFDQAAGSPFIFQSQSTGVDLTGDGVPDGRTGPLGRINAIPFSSIGVDPSTFPLSRTGNTYQIADTFIWDHGRGTLKFGGDVRRVESNSLNDRDFRLTLTYAPNIIIGQDGIPRYASGADFIGLGIPSDIRQTLSVVPNSNLGLRNYEANFFANETFRIHPRVTIKGGFRYEINTVPRDSDRRFESAFAVTPASFPVGPNDMATAQPFFDALNGFQQFVSGRRNIFDADRNNFSARVGVAWDVFGDGRTAVRGGYGLYYDPIPLTITGQSRNVFPNFIQTNFRSGVMFNDILRANPSFVPFRPGCSDPFPPIDGTGRILPPSFDGCPPSVIQSGSLPVSVGQLLGQQGFALAFALPRRDLGSARVQQYTFSIERAFADKIVASIAYVGTSGRGFVRPGTPNGGPVAPVLFTQASDANPFDFIQVLQNRTDQRIGAITGFSSDTNSQYHSLQMAVSQRFSSGLAFQAAYTYSHSIDSISDLFDTAGGFIRAQDELNIPAIRTAERGSSSFDVRHRFVVGALYELPFLRQNRFLGGYQLSSIVTLQSGQPYTINTGLDVNQDGNRTDRLNTFNGLTFSDSGAQRVAVNPGVNPLQLLAFDPVALQGRNGAIGRNTLRSSGLALVDVGLAKRFAFTDRHVLTFRAEAFNLFNRTNFGVPTRVLEAPGFGSSFATSAPPRSFQFVMKFDF
jgi:hypothetical protein